MFPRIVVDMKKLHENAERLVNMSKAQGINMYVVTKVHSADLRLAQVCLDAGVYGLADSRIQNLEKLSVLGGEKVLLRLPMHSEVDKVVKFADISFNSELSTIGKLNDAAKKIGVKHKILVMFDLGDLREGFLPEEVDVVIPEILKYENIIIEGIGVNLTCYGGVIPSEENLGELTRLAKHIESTYGIKLNIVSGGNSSSLYLLEKGELPKGINNLRVGEGIVLGREAAYGELMKDMHDDAFILEAEIIEYKTKESMPKGQIGMDAFGNKPSFVDKGIMKRGIVAIGRQDVEHTALFPLDPRIEIIGASSDHMLLDFTAVQEDYKVGDVIKFKMEYSAMLKLFTSEFVDRISLG
ncbi:MAG TPA: alanine racemase [Clostridiales bacterium UBA8960]|nr:alanine racemase [Clostridiales bacterium UBA8960]